MNRLEQLFESLGYTRENGLFYIGESDQWLDKFPYRISKVLKEIIQPYAFYSLHHHGDESVEHPEPINNPIILFFDNPDEKKRKEIPKWAFCFGQAPVVIINNDETTTLDIYHGYQFEDQNYTLKRLNTDADIFSTINLTLGKTWKKLYAQYYKDVPKVDKYLLKNIIDARRILIASDSLKLSPKIANRLIGRLLFIRYLIDRHVEFPEQSFLQGTNKSERQEHLNELIKDKDNLYSFFNYLDGKFKGDLFPLNDEGVNIDTGEIYPVNIENQEVNNEHLDILHNLFAGSSFFKTGSSYNGYAVQKSLFMVYDFEIIPVELISNIYENFIGKEEENENVSLEKFKEHSKQFDIKAYYTPPFIVDYILSQTVSPHLENATEASCKVLDPSCGSGIFLVETLRKIIEKEIAINCKNNSYKLTNERLWELVHKNIFGIDIDEDAIEITVFSLYITLLDYKTPKEIESFKFEGLKNNNLFGGSGYDFFNTEASFNEVFTNDVALDVIFGNPPWGKVEMSIYETYIANRKAREFARTWPQSVIHPELKLEIGNREISQAFLIRVSDFAINPKLKIALVVTGKSLYNSEKTTKQWREYFLANFVVSQVFELSGVNNKIVGGSQIFERAKMAPAIFFYGVAKNTDEIIKNVITHITVKPNRFFNYFRTIVIEKHDIKKVLQKNFMPLYDGYDWLWKVLLHGHVLDFHFMKRLKTFSSIKKIMKDYNLDSNGGLKIKDGSRKVNTSQISNFYFLDVDNKKEFQPYSAHPSERWSKYVLELQLRNLKTTSKRNQIDSEGNVGYLPNIHFFMGEKLLVKKGLQANDDFKAVAAYNSDNVAFTATVCSIKTKEGKERIEGTSAVLQSLTGIINSNFFSYYLLQTSSSAGIDRTRADFAEILSAPAAVDQNFAASVLELQQKYDDLRQITFHDNFYHSQLEEIKLLNDSVNKHLYTAFHITSQEESLIKYATEIALPILKRAEETGYGKLNIFRALEIDNDDDKIYLSKYSTVFINHFKHRFNSVEQSFYVNIYISDDFIGTHFIVGPLPVTGQNIYFKTTSDAQLLSELGNLGIHNVTRDLYIQQDVRGFHLNTFYVIKPNEFKCWHEANAHHDLLEFIDALAQAEVADLTKTELT